MILIVFHVFEGWICYWRLNPIFDVKANETFPLDIRFDNWVFLDLDPFQELHNTRLKKGCFISFFIHKHMFVFQEFETPSKLWTFPSFELSDFTEWYKWEKLEWSRAFPVVRVALRIDGETGCSELLRLGQTFSQCETRDVFCSLCSFSRFIHVTWKFAALGR